jgi:cell wall-associated NlpC family hydrolase
MKKFLLFAVMLATAVSCDQYDDSAIWEEIALQDRRDRLETLSNRMNTNISSLKTIVSAISAEDRISDVIKIMEDGKDAGYMLVFVNSGSAALYHWTDVNEGYTPCIGVRKDNSGTFCWVLDGDWILDDISNRIPAGSGQTAIPKLKLDAENWWLSVDDGETWQQLETSVQGEESCSFFQNIDPAQKQNVTITFNDGTKITLPKEEEKDPADNGTYDPWDGYTDPDVYEEQDIINLTNALMANMHDCNLATRHVMDIAYNFWKRRGEFIYCSNTAKDKPWDYWSYVGYKDGNTGFTVGEGHGGYKRIDCSTFVSYVINGVDYYSTPYFNALEWTEVKQGALTASGAETASTDKTVCRSGKIYLRHGKKHILESSNTSKYKFNKIFAYSREGKMVQNLTGKTSFTLPAGAEYIRVEMKVSSASDYAAAVKGVSPAAILKCLRIRESETLSVVAGNPERYTREMSQWFDENGYGLEAYTDYNPVCWEDSDFEPGTVVFMGKTGSSGYKNITHVTLYIGG